MRKRKKMRREKTGKLASALVTALLLFVVSLQSFAQAPAGTSQPAAEKKAKQKTGLAVISGTVFRDSGLSFAGIEVILQPQPEGKASNKPGKKMKTVSDSRGEYSFRVPAKPMRYTVSVQAPGYQPEKSQVSINGEERQDVFFTLKPDAAKK